MLIVILSLIKKIKSFFTYEFLDHRILNIIIVIPWILGIAQVHPIYPLFAIILLHSKIYTYMSMNLH